MSDKTTLLEDVLPLLKILEEGKLTVSKPLKPIGDRLLTLRWAVQSRYKSVIELTDKGRGSIPELLSNQWPEWQKTRDALKGADLPIDMASIFELERANRLNGLNVPSMIHCKTITSILGKHSKTGVSKRLAAALPNTTITTDQTLRFYANKGLELKAKDGFTQSCDPLMAILGEVAVPERAFLHGLQLCGTMPKVIFTVENKGAFIDFPVTADKIMVVFVPGNDQALAVQLLSLLPSEIPHYHFGDLDPKGIEIYSGIDKKVPQTSKLFVPKIWTDYYEVSLANKKCWPVIDGDIAKIPLISTLMADDTWLEQECILLDPRLVVDILVCVNKDHLFASSAESVGREP
jgi:hypothetical protein